MMNWRVICDGKKASMIMREIRKILSDDVSISFIVGMVSHIDVTNPLMQQTIFRWIVAIVSTVFISTHRTISLVENVKWKVSMSEHEHTFQEICDDEVCGICYEKELMKGKVKFAPRHANQPVIHFDTIHMQNYRKQIESGRKKNG
jgi:hypothetical protein